MTTDVNSGDDNYPVMQSSLSFYFCFQSNVGALELDSCTIIVYYNDYCHFA